MEGFGVHTSMWTMNWDRAGARTIPAAAAYKMDFIEIALLNAPAVDAAHTRASGQARDARRRLAGAAGTQLGQRQPPTAPSPT